MKRNMTKRTLLGAAILVALASPAWAGDVCDGSNAAGEQTLGSTSTGDGTVACGRDNVAGGSGTANDFSSAFGVSNVASGWRSSAYGYNNDATGEGSSAFGFTSDAEADFSTAVGAGNTAGGVRSSAMGYGNQADGERSSTFGYNNAAISFESNAFGSFNNADGLFSSAFGYSNSAEGDHSSAFGYLTIASGVDSSAFGSHASALNLGSTAIGYGAVADRDYAVSVGSAGDEHQIIHVADGTADTDAVNVRQLNAAIASVSGGGGGADPLAVHYDDVGKGTMTLEGASGTQIKNVAAGVAATDAVNKGQMDAGDAATLTAANAHADAGDTATLASANAHADAGDATTLASSRAYTDQRFAQVPGLAGLTELRNDMEARFAGVNDRFVQTDARIDRSGAMQTAMAQMTASAAGIRTANRVAVGVGFQHGEKALSVGYQRAVGGNAALTLGGAFSGDERSVGMGYGIGW